MRGVNTSSLTQCETTGTSETNTLKQVSIPTSNSLEPSTNNIMKSVSSLSLMVVSENSTATAVMDSDAN